MAKERGPRIREIDADQPGIFTKTSITRDNIVKACEALGINPVRVRDIHIAHEAVTVEAFIHDTDGSKVLPSIPWTEGSGYLKHTYVMPISDNP